MLICVDTCVAVLPSGWCLSRGWQVVLKGSIHSKYVSPWITCNCVVLWALWRSSHPYFKMQAQCVPTRCHLQKQVCIQLVAPVVKRQLITVGIWLWFYLFFIFLFWVFRDRVLQCSSGCPGILSVHQTGLELTSTYLCPPTPSTGIEVCAIIDRPLFFEIGFWYIALTDLELKLRWFMGKPPASRLQSSENTDLSHHSRHVALKISESHFVSQANLELTSILWPQHLEFWDYRF